MVVDVDEVVMEGYHSTTRPHAHPRPYKSGGLGERLTPYFIK